MHNPPFAFLLFSTALASGLAAQNLFEIYPSCTTHTSRGTLNGAAGEVLLQIPGSHFIGVGHVPNGLSSQARGMRFVMQDQDAATQDNFSVVIRADLAGAPDCSASGLLATMGPLTPPPAVGITAWQLTVTFAAPVGIPQCDTFYVGVGLAAANWTADGQSLHVARYDSGSNAATNAVNLAWNCASSGASSQPATARTIRIGPLVAAAVLNMGNVDPLGTRCMGPGADFGAGGLWPVCEGTTGTMRNDALHFRVRDDALPAGACAVYAWPFTACASAYPFPFADGAWYLSPGYSGLFIGGGLLTNGEASGPTILTPALVKANCALLSLPMYYQAIVVQGGLIHTTNRAGTVFGTP